MQRNVHPLFILLTLIYTCTRFVAHIAYLLQLLCLQNQQYTTRGTKGRIILHFTFQDDFFTHFTHGYTTPRCTRQIRVCPFKRRNRMPIFGQLLDLNARPLLSIKKRPNNHRTALLYERDFLYRKTRIKPSKRRRLKILPKQSAAHVYFKAFSGRSRQGSHLVNSATRLCLVTPLPV